MVTQMQGTSDTWQMWQFCLFLLFPHHSKKPFLVWEEHVSSFMETSAFCQSPNQTLLYLQQARLCQSLQIKIIVLKSSILSSISKGNMKPQRSYLQKFNRRQEMTQRVNHQEQQNKELQRRNNLPFFFYALNSSG